MIVGDTQENQVLKFFHGISIACLHVLSAVSENGKRFPRCFRFTQELYCPCPRRNTILTKVFILFIHIKSRDYDKYIVFTSTRIGEALTSERCSGSSKYR